jgi:hypothetical protein
MTTPEALDALQRIAERAPAGRGVAMSALNDAGVSAGTVRDLQVEGLLEVVEGDADTVHLTEAGRAVLTPRNSA